MSNRPTPGRIVTLKGFDSNGINEHPAIITRVWRDDLVNLTVFPDAAVPTSFTSVVLMEDRDAAEAHLQSLSKTIIGARCAFWPERIGPFQPGLPPKRPAKQSEGAAGGG